MVKSRKTAMILGASAAAIALGVVGWAVATSVVSASRAAELVDEARGILSPPAEVDLEAVDCDGAAALLREAREVDGRGGTRRLLPLAEGCASLRRGDLILAEGELREAISRLPGDPRPLVWLGALELSRDAPEAALDRFDQALELDGGHHHALVGRSDALAELGRVEESLSVLEQRPGPTRASVETRRGLLLEELERTDEARVAYGRAIELSPEMAEPYNNLAALERDAGNLEAAWRHQEAAVERAPDDPLMLRNAGLLALSLGRDERGEALLRRAAELDPDSPDALRALADHLLVSGEVEGARRILIEAAQRFPRDGALLNSLGNVLAAAGRHEEALAAYRSAIEADGELAQPHNGLAALLLAAGDLDAAEAELSTAARLDPADPQVRRNLAELHRRRGEPALADRQLRIARAVRSL